MKHVYKFVLTEIRFLDVRKKELAELEEQVIESSATPDGQPRGNMTSDSTSSRALKLISNERIQFLKREIEAIEEIRSELKDEYKDVFEETIIKNCCDIKAKAYFIGVSERNIFYIRKRILKSIAIKMGLE